MIGHRDMAWVVTVITAHLHSIKPELWFCAGSNPACDVWNISIGEDLCNGLNCK